MHHNDLELYLKVKRFLEQNKVFFETIAFVSISFMALIVSFAQCNIEKQQEKLLKTQTEFLYTPNLKVSLEGIWDSKYKLVLKNEGSTNIDAIKIYVHSATYFTHSNEFSFYMKSNIPWEKISTLGAGKTDTLEIDTSDVSRRFSFYQFHKEADISPEWSYLTIPINIYEIKYQSGPDHKDFSIKKYFRIARDSKSEKLLIGDQEEWAIPFINNKKMRSTPIE